MNLKKILTLATLSLILFACDDSSSTGGSGSEETGVQGTWRFSFEDDIDGEIETGYYLYNFNSDNSYTRTLTLTNPDEGTIQSTEGVYTVTDTELAIKCVTEYRGEIASGVESRDCTRDFTFDYTLSDNTLTLNYTFEDEGETFTDITVYIKD